MLNKEIAAYIALNIVSKIFPFIFLPFVADSLGIGDYATYGTIAALAGFLSFLSSLSFDSGLNKFYETSRHSDENLIKTLLTVLYLLTTIFLFAAPIILHSFFDYRITEMLFLVAVPLYATWIGVWDRYLRITHELKIYVLTILARNLVLYVPVAVLLVTSYLGYDSFLLICGMQSISMAIAAMIYFIYIIGLPSDFKGFHRIWSYCRPLIPNKMVAFGIQPGLIYCVKFIYSLEALAVFIFSQTLGNGLNVVTQAIINAINPLIFRAQTENTIASDTRKILAPQAAYGLLCILFIAFCDEFVSMYAPVDFEGVKYILPYFILYSWVNFNKNLFLTYAMIEESKVKYVPYSTYLFVVLTFGLTFYLSGSYDVQVVVVAMIFGRVISAVWLLLVSGQAQVTLPVALIGLTGVTVMSAQLISL